MAYRTEGVVIITSSVTQMDHLKIVDLSKSNPE